MPKQKTRKTISKRFKITAKKRVFRGHQSARHKKATKSRRRIRTFAKMSEVLGHEARLIKQLI